MAAALPPTAVDPCRARLLNPLPLLLQPPLPPAT
jgi:hypothetical protein